MDKNYVVFSLKLAAWWGGAGSPYTSNMNAATRYSHADAIAVCKKHYDNQSGLGAVPVCLDDVEAIRAK